MAWAETPNLTILHVGSAMGGGLVADASGNFYGTEDFGGAGFGTVFKLAGPAHTTMTSVGTFSGSNGQFPGRALHVDSAGNIYGTTRYGGPTDNGTVYELSGGNPQVLTMLAGFAFSNGSRPSGGVIADAAGNLYGTTAQGGKIGIDTNLGRGTVYELSGANHETLTTLVTFSGANGDAPQGSLIADASGNVYGVTSAGGAYSLGTVFELSGTNHQTLTTLVSFDRTNGSSPFAGLTADAGGNLYGTTFSGGTYDKGSVFELSGPNHQTLTTLVSFNGTNGSGPEAGVIVDAAGNIFGTTSAGGAGGVGTVFKLTESTHEALTTLVSFNGANGADPFAELLADASGNLYGTTWSSSYGGGEDGVVYQLTGSGYVVPEPGSLALLGLGALGLLGRRRDARRASVIVSVLP